MDKSLDRVLQLDVNMLGRFSVSMDGQVLLEDQGHSRKVWNLFAFLIANKDRVLDPTELPELLCSDERSDDPEKAVKNLIYRLRCLLKDSPLPEADYIKQKGGIYRWNDKVSVVLDTELFQQRWHEAKSASEDDLALAKYMEAIDLYNGRFLPRMVYEEWTLGLSAQFQRIFVECVTNAFAILEQRGDDRKIIPICEKAISIDPFDEEIYKIYIKALTALNMQREALVAYETITGRLYAEMGVSPSKELLLLYRHMLKTIKSVETDLQAIKGDLNEQEALGGAYFCEYEIFKDVYRFVARGVDRNGDSIYIMLCTLTDERDEIPDITRLGQDMEKLNYVIAQTLRKGDLFARYSCTQYVVMLPCTSFENSQKVGERLVRAHGKYNTSKRIKLHFKCQPLDPKIQ